MSTGARECQQEPADDEGDQDIFGEGTAQSEGNRGVEVSESADIVNREADDQPPLQSGSQGGHGNGPTEAAGKGWGNTTRIVLTREGETPH